MASRSRRDPLIVAARGAGADEAAAALDPLAGAVEVLVLAGEDTLEAFNRDLEPEWRMATGVVRVYLPVALGSAASQVFRPPRGAEGMQRATRDCEKFLARHGWFTAPVDGAGRGEALAVENGKLRERVMQLQRDTRELQDQLDELRQRSDGADELLTIPRHSLTTRFSSSTCGKFLSVNVT